MRFPRLKTVCIASILSIVSCHPLLVRACPPTMPDNVDEPAEIPAANQSIVIPGPLRSFLRMAGISQEVVPEDVLPLLARNLALYGFEEGKEKEFLILVDRYVHQAREIQQLAGSNGEIHVNGCGDVSELLRILGYKFQRACGYPNASLVTANAERAFLTIDSGFPLTELEQAMQKNSAFTYSYPSTRVPIFFTEDDWIAVSHWKHRPGDTVLDALLHDQELDRLYAAMAKYDLETREALNTSAGLKRLLPLAAVLDLYGGQISIRSGRVIVPGNESVWESLVGESTQSPGRFVINLLTRDGGWLAAYFDVLSRLNPAQQAHLTDANRLKRFYDVYRSTALTTSASRGIYPRNGDLLLLFTSLRWKDDGDFTVPGDLAIWDEILTQMARSRQMRLWLKRTREWNTSGKLLESLVAASNLQSDIGPDQMFLMLSAMNSERSPERQLSDETDRLVAKRFAQFNHWFPIFAEFQSLDDAAITKFMNAADRLDSIANLSLRANALGAFQANLGIWQILARQGQIRPEQLNSTWQEVVQPFLGVASSVQLFDATRRSLQSVLAAASDGRNLTQDQIIDLLAGPVHDDRDSQRVHHEIAERIRGVLEDQRLVSLDTLFGLYDGMMESAHGSQAIGSLLPLAENLREFEMPRPIFTGNERSSWSPIVYSSRHAELQVRTDLTKIFKSQPTSAQLEAARGQLTPFLRDTLVGLNYAYYEPPGAEVLHNNPLFVRSHDFTSISVQGTQQIWGVPRLVGIGATAGGGAYLLGSLADLPYALASTEEDFIVPKKTQALIWKEIVPDLLVGATLPRWWNVSHNEMHFAALYQQTGEELLRSAAGNAELRAKVFSILSERVPLVWLDRTARALQDPHSTRAMIAQTPPADLFFLAVEFMERYPGEISAGGSAGQELQELARKYPSDSRLERLSVDFGVPHPGLMLTNSSSLLNMKAISTFGGNAGRMFAESWDSNNLYWARLADEMGYSPVELNLLVPELTRNMITNIFATNIDDWPALLRAMEETGDEFRRGKFPLQAVSTPQ